MTEKTHTGQRREKLAWTAEFFHCLPFNSSALYYHQTPTRRYGHASMPPRFLPITGHRNVSLPPSFEWHVWSSSSGNNCHAVHRSLSSGASLCDGTVGFLPCPILSAKLYFTNTMCWYRQNFISCTVPSGSLFHPAMLSLLFLWC